MLTNLNKVFWEAEGYTKGDVIAFYQSIAPIILPYLRDRPLVLNRHPNGIDGESFFQKNVKESELPTFVQTALINHRTKSIRYILVNNEATLLFVANLGCIELNPFHSRVGRINRPDYFMIDLDPEDVGFEKVVQAALVVHETLNELDMDNYCKTSGGRGLHIYVPLGAKYDFEQVHHAALLIALLVQNKLPDLISLERSPKKRQKQIYIDVPRNSPKQTIVAPYSLRPRPGALVSTPLAWKEVTKTLDPGKLNIRNLRSRVDRVGDLFEPVLKKGIDLRHSLALLNKKLEQD